jgi:FkbM family methyltransferase
MTLRDRLLISPLYDWFGKRSFAQSGEDIIADLELGKKKKGIYIDVGAFHPKLFSNTYLFYKRGWNGVVIEPNPEAEEWFLKVRPRDKFVGLGVGAKKDVLEFFEFNEAQANTFSKEQAKKNISEAGRKLLRRKNIAVVPLRDILASYKMERMEIDLMSVDVEGMDLEVLESNDWKKYRPRLVICEDLGFNFLNPRSSDVTKFLLKLDYRLVAKTPYSLIFRDKKR